MFQVLITLQTLCKCPKFYKLLQTILNKINLSWKEEIFFLLLLQAKNSNILYHEKEIFINDELIFYLPILNIEDQHENWKYWQGRD